MDKHFPFERSDSEWRQMLTAEQYRIMRGARHRGAGELRAAA